MSDRSNLDTELRKHALAAQKKRYHDPHEHLIVPAPAPCPHGHGLTCDCQLPWYAGLFVAPIHDSTTDVVRRVICRMRQTHDGGMREFLDPVSGRTVGSCGLFFANEEVKTLDNWLVEHQRTGERIA